jgi:hypothetical protein
MESGVVEESERLVDKNVGSDMQNESWINEKGETAAQEMDFVMARLKNWFLIDEKGLVAKR